MKVDKTLFPSETWVMETSCGKFYVIVDFDHKRENIIRVGVSAGKAGGCASATLTPLTRRVTELLSSSLADRILYLTEMTGTRCYQPDNCVALMAKKLLDIELYLEGGRG